MKIELPLETWTDVFGSVSRFKLIHLVPNLEDRTTINDRQFVSFVQFYLHECGEITLDYLSIGSPRIFHWDEDEDYFNLPLADVPMPKNIKNFTRLSLRNCDNSIIRFLQEFQRNSLLTNVNLDIGPINVFPQFMANFWNLFTDIKSIKIDSRALDSIQCEHFDLAKPLLASARILHTKYNRRDCWFCEWLHTPREDGRPRILVLDPPRHANPLHLIRHIKKDFMEAIQPISFFIHLNEFSASDNVQSLSLDKSLRSNKAK